MEHFTKSFSEESWCGTCILGSKFCPSDCPEYQRLLFSSNVGEAPIYRIFDANISDKNKCVNASNTNALHFICNINYNNDNDNDNDNDNES